MKKSTIWIFLTITLVFAAFVGGVYVGRNFDRADVHIGEATTVTTSTGPQNMNPAQPDGSSAGTPTSAPTQPVFPININTATVEQLDLLPEIGPVLAQRIVDYRNESGPFENVTDLLYVSGIGEKTLAKILALITV